MNSIDSNNFILFYNNESESFHALVVVGYEADGTQIVYDSTYGYLIEGTYYIDLDKSVAIAGAKNGK